MGGIKTQFDKCDNPIISKYSDWNSDVGYETSQIVEEVSSSSKPGGHQ